MGWGAMRRSTWSRRAAATRSATPTTATPARWRGRPHRADERRRRGRPGRAADPVLQRPAARGRGMTPVVATRATSLPGAGPARLRQRQPGRPDARASVPTCGVPGAPTTSSGCPPRRATSWCWSTGWAGTWSAAPPGRRRSSPACSAPAGRSPPASPAPPSPASTSLGTGLPPGQHGMVGYTSRVPDTGEILNALTWESDCWPAAYQPRDDLLRAGASPRASPSARSALQRFQDSGLTEAALRGRRVRPLRARAGRGAPDRAGRRRGRAGDRSLVYAYERAAGPRRARLRLRVGGVAAPAHPDRRDVRAAPGRAARRRRSWSSPATTAWWTCPSTHQVIAEDEPELLAGRLRAGRRGTLPPALRRRRRPGAGRGALAPTGSASTPGCGPATRPSTRGGSAPSRDDLRERYGHVLVAMRGNWAVMTRQYPRELSLVGMHGSLTQAEMLVPLLLG